MGESIDLDESHVVIQLRKCVLVCVRHLPWDLPVHTSIQSYRNSFTTPQQYLAFKACLLALHVILGQAMLLCFNKE